MSEITFYYSPLLTSALSVPGASIHLYRRQESCAGRRWVTSPSSGHPTLKPAHTYAPLPRPSHSATQPLVGIIMGSDSGLPVMIAGARILDDFKIPYKLTIVSGHRTPERLHTYSQSTASQGFVAGAGGAAHLPSEYDTARCDW